eukprot:2559616-Amphidinium_carterae.1
MRQSGDSLEVAQLRAGLALDKAKLEQLTWKEGQRARDIREAREQILRGNAQHMERIAESRNKEVSLSGTAWTQKPPDGLKEFIDQVYISEADGLSALVMAATSTPRQEVVPTNLAIFSDVEAPPLRVASPVTPVKSTTSPDESFLASGDRCVSKTPFSSMESSPKVAVRAGRVHVSPAPDGGGDGGGDDSPQRDEPSDPWHGE